MYVPLMDLACLVAPFLQHLHPGVRRKRRQTRREKRHAARAAKNRQLAQRRKRASARTESDTVYIYVPVARATVKITELPH